MKKISFPQGRFGRGDVANLHTALRRLGEKVDPEELRRAELGETTREALRKLQRKAGLTPDGNVTPETVEVLNKELEHVYYAGSKKRTEKIHASLERLGYRIDPEEKKARSFGGSTGEAMKDFQAKAGLLQEGRSSEPVVRRLEEEALKKRLKSKTQVGRFHRTFLRAGRIARLELELDAGELKRKELGPTTRAAISAFQKKYNLPETGEPDLLTMERINSVAVCRSSSPKNLHVKSAVNLVPLTRVLRLNMTNKHVGELQQALAYLGYRVDQKEYNTKTFGKTTRQAVLAYQSQYGLPASGHVEADTLDSLNYRIHSVNPQAFKVKHLFRVRGSVRDEHWKGKAGVKVRVYEKLLRDQGVLLAERKTLKNGFFDIPYNPPRNPADGQIKAPFHLLIKVVDKDNRELMPGKVLFNPTSIDWVNFTAGKEPYRGISEFESRTKTVEKILGNVSMAEVEEREGRQEITYLALHTGLSQDDVMRLVLSHRAALQLNNPDMEPDTGSAVFYAFIRQNMPPNLPGDLLDSTKEWTVLMDFLVEETVNGVVFMEGDLQDQVFQNAISENLIPINVSLNKDAILNALSAERQRFTLEKPILAGNGSLKLLLDASRVDSQHYNNVADTFLKCGGFNADFWSQVRSQPADFGGEVSVQDLEKTVTLGYITSNHAQTLSFLKGKLENPSPSPPGVPQLNLPRDLAKLAHDDWVMLLQENGGAVSDGIDGVSSDEQLQVYAGILAQQSEQLYPSVAFAARAGRSTDTSLTRTQDVQQLLDEQPELELGTINLDLFVHEKGISLDKEVLGEIKVMQRVQRIATNAEAATALLEGRIHHSAQILAKGKEEFIRLLEIKGIQRRTALTVYARAEFQYAQVLTRLAEYRNELYHNHPKAIIPYTCTEEDQEQLLAGIPNLEFLFGSMDFCDCSHCRSVYGPPAYLADLLRFLDEKETEKEGEKAGRFLLERRPDIGNVKMNCVNTDTPLPYIDLVCEILENDIYKNAVISQNEGLDPSPDQDFGFQTGLTAEELRAFPENVRREVYDLLKTSNYPMNIAFDLWQEETRLFLQHLGVSRWELMEAFQAHPQEETALPVATSIAGEYFGISTHETGIVTDCADTISEQSIFWGFDIASSTIGVSQFLERAQLDYHELLELLEVRWINPQGAPDNIILMRPVDNCDIGAQSLKNLTAQKFDRIHRFLRLWRRTGWKMWELDLLIRAEGIGEGVMDGKALVCLKEFKQVQEKLGLPLEAALSFFHQLNTEIRNKPDEPEVKIMPLYHQLFQNRAVTDPVDSKFSLPLSGNEELKEHRGTLLAALAVTETELALLLEVTGGKLTLSNLNLLYGLVTLARSLKVTVRDLLTLKELTGGTGYFGSPRDILGLIEIHQWIKNSGLTIQELEYLFTLCPDSPCGLREDVITQKIEGLRETLRSSPAGQNEGQIVSQVAGSFMLTDEQALLLLTRLELGSVLLVHFQDPRLMEKDSDNRYKTPVTLENFPDLYATYRFLHKTVLLVRRHDIEQKDDLSWLLKNAAAYKLLDMNALPVKAQPEEPLFPGWLRLQKWLYFKSQCPEQEGISLPEIFELAADPETGFAKLRDALNLLTSWPVSDLEALHIGLKLKQGLSSDYTEVDTYLRLEKCFKHSRRIGAAAGILVGWANRDSDADNTQFNISQQVRQATRSKYDTAVWLSKLTPLQDEMREKKRDALISFLLEYSWRKEPQEVEILSGGKKYANPRRWRDAHDLLGYFLIDVEMSAIVMTSRIKQAISSVQMFVQRCFLNLEQPYIQVSREEREERVSENSWRQWKWMKNYRIWEANRKVFLYPENWIEPELRDDKSPFFKELENELVQSDITHENAEATLRHYLQKVHEVAHLEVAGVYHQVDDGDNLHDDNLPGINVLHVIGRTRSQPAVYYYRQFDLNYDTWSAWDKIDLEITGDHVAPVVYNRKLHLFWPIFVEKPQKVKKQPPAKASDIPEDIPEAPKKLEIQLAWSVYTLEGWSSKKISRLKLIHPWERPLYSYNLKPRYKSRENLLWLDIYISTSQEFNNATFYDPYSNSYRRLTSTDYHEESRPWHSSSFIFDGDVVDIKLKPLAGHYRILNSEGFASDQLFSTTSHRYVQDSFGDAGRATGCLSGPYEIAPRLRLPVGMRYHNNRLVNNSSNPNELKILESSAVRTVLKGAKDPFELFFSQHQIQFDAAAGTRAPFFYQDSSRTFLMRPECQTFNLGDNLALQSLKHNIYPFDHPYTDLFTRELNRSGMEGLLNRHIQLYPHSYYPGNSFDFNAVYEPVWPNKADTTAVRDIVDFSRDGAYSIYNWEIFFHAPFLIACKLSQNQRFEEAMEWFHYIFDPTSVQALSVPQRYWITKPFYEQNSEDYRRQRIHELLKNINGNAKQVMDWKNNPFKPHLIARYRPVAYQKAVVMKYIDNLIAWGDQLFRQDTIESVNEATMLYILAYELLGRRPVKVPPVDRPDYSYNELAAEKGFDIFGNSRVEVLLENFLETPVQVVSTEEGSEPLPQLDMFYFCIPGNDRLLGYWDTVEDRLFKIRHSMNIEGVMRQLPLFQPPIDPALLVKAAAAGVDLSSVLSDTAVPQSQYHFRILAQKAREFIGQVKVLGDKLLSVLEKRDAEELALLRSVQELDLLEAIEVVRKQQIDEAQQTRAGLEKARDSAEERKNYYEGKEFMNMLENVSDALATGSIIVSGGLAISEIIAANFYLAPSFSSGISGFGGSAHVTTTWGTDNIARSMQASNSALAHLGSILSQSSSMVGTIAGYQRRQEEWDFQGRLAAIEVEQLNKQIEAARIRHAIAEKELENQQLQIEQSQAVEEYMRSKYTNQQLYDWMVSRLATVYFQSYQLAYDMAKRAEGTFQLELGKADTNYIQFGYWDSLKKGLLAGEKLANDLNRMEAAYLDLNKRELELTKHVSLMHYFPQKLLELKLTGACNIALPEWLLDMDYPGHYRRRIKSVSISIPCVVGPYTGVNCTLSLTNNGVRLTDEVAGGYGDPLAGNDTRFARNPVPIRSIATSTARNDAGMFELNFNDERFLPFEGAGAVSEWSISLPKENNHFDISTISDVIMHISYTAAPGSPALADAARDNLAAVLPESGVRLFFLNHEFGSEWHRFFHAGGHAHQVLSFSLKPEHLPFYARNKTAHLTRVDLMVESSHDGSFEVNLQLPGHGAADIEIMNKNPVFGDMHHMEKADIFPGTPVLGEWQVKLKKDDIPDFQSLQESDLVSAYLLIRFSLQ